MADHRLRKPLLSGLYSLTAQKTIDCLNENNNVVGGFITCRSKMHENNSIKAGRGEKEVFY